MNEKNVYIITSPHGIPTVNRCWLYPSCGSWSLWPLPFREPMPENGATLVELSSLRKRGRLWTYFSRLGDCTDRHVCLHKKINAWFWQKHKRGTRWIFFSHFVLIIWTNEARGGTNAELKANLLDIHNQRLRFMDENNVDYVRRSVFFVVGIISWRKMMIDGHFMCQSLHSRHLGRSHCWRYGCHG